MPLLLHKKDEFDGRDHIFPMLAPRLPKAMSMSNTLGPERDQAESGSCTGQASGGFLDWLYNTQKKYFKGTVPEGDYFSALFIYAMERAKNGTFPNDSGSDSRTAFEVLRGEGACLNSQMPFSDLLLALQPTDEQSQEATKYTIGAYHRVLVDDNLQSFRACLASGYCRIIGIPVYEGLESDECAETGMLPLPKQTDTPIGGHEMLVYGYNDVDRVELVRNSWGASWGLNGNLKIPYDYYTIVGGNDTCDSWTAHMGKPWIPKKVN